MLTLNLPEPRTHLAAEDTTDRTAPSQRPAHVVLNKTRKRMAGVGDLDEPFKRRKIKKVTPTQK